MIYKNLPPEEERDENAGNDNVTKTKHGEIGGSETVFQQILKSQKCRINQKPVFRFRT